MGKLVEEIKFSVKVDRKMGKIWKKRNFHVKDEFLVDIQDDSESISFTQNPKSRQKVG